MIDISLTIMVVYTKMAPRWQKKNRPEPRKPQFPELIPDTPIDIARILMGVSPVRQKTRTNCRSFCRGFEGTKSPIGRRSSSRAAR